MEHFTATPQWGWYIVWYFFLGGLSGGAYAIGALLRLRGDDADGAVARRAFLLAFPTLAICPLLLALDLGQPERFWHMLVDPQHGLNFKYWSPMSLGSWVLVAYSVFPTVAFADAVLGKGWLAGAGGRVFHAVGGVLGLALAGYTGVLLSVSNQPVWSDTWVLGGLFLASGLSVAAAAIGLLTRAEEAGTSRKLGAVDGCFLLLELLLLAALFATLGGAAAPLVRGPWLLLWLVVLAGILVPLLLHRRAVGRSALPAVLALAGGLALRVVIVLGPQA